MSVSKTRSGTYRVRYYDHTGRERQRNFRLKKDAERVDRELARKRELRPFGLSVETEPMTAAELYEDWMRNHVRPNLARNTREGYEVIWASVLAERIGELDVRELSAAYISDLAAALTTAGLGLPTRSKALAILSGMLRRAVVKGVLDHHPMRGAVKVPQPKRARVVNPPGPEAIWQAADRLEAAGDDDGRTLALVLGFAGLRPEEALGLDWRDVGKRTINVERVAVHGELVPTTKTGQARSVELLPALERELVAFRLRKGLPAKGLVLAAAGGKPWNDYAYRNWRNRSFKPVTRIARPYDLRHAFASLLLHEGRSVIEVAEQLGHSATVCLDTYGHVIRELAGARRVKAATAVERARAATLGARTAGPGEKAGPERAREERGE